MNNEYSNYNHDYLVHYGVKGMKWGVRRERNKAAKQKYKAEKRRIAQEGGKAQARRETRDLKANHDYTYTGKASRQDMLIRQYDSTKQYNKDMAKLREQKAAAKRDYKIAKGRNEDRANKKYNRTVRDIGIDKRQSDQDALNDLYMASPTAAKTLNQMGKINTSELNTARIHAGTEAVRLLLGGYDMYKTIKK